MKGSLVTIATDFSASNAEIIRAMLVENGIDCHLDGAQQGGLTGVQAIGILVRQEDADQAKRLIANCDTSPESGDAN